jgi:hypothetical protein
MPTPLLPTRRPALAAALAAALLVAGCGNAPDDARPTSPGIASPGVASPDPADPPPLDPGRPVEATGGRDGVRVVLHLEHDRLSAGGTQRARILVSNEGPGTAYWEGTECQLVSAMQVEPPPAPPERPGRAWDGDFGVLKSISLQGPGVATFMIPDALARGELSQGCDAVGAIGEIPAGGVLAIDAGWPALTLYGAPAPPGAYRARLPFPYLGRGPFPPAFGEGPAVPPIDVELPFTVAGAVLAGISPGEAIDAALADGRFGGWLASIDRRRWSSSHLRFVDGTWQLGFTYDAQEGAGRTAEVRVHPASGAVLEVRLPGS